jgi:hypothetical protein
MLVEVCVKVGDAKVGMVVQCLVVVFSGDSVGAWM